MQSWKTDTADSCPDVIWQVKIDLLQGITLALRLQRERADHLKRGHPLLEIRTPREVSVDE